MKMLVIYNPKSGGAIAENFLESLKIKLLPLDHDIEILPLAGESWSAAVKQAIQRGDALVVVAGGDGSVNAVAALLIGTQTSLGVLPVGTLNHFAADIGVPSDLAQAVDVLKNGVDVQVDTAEVNGQVFINNSSIGLYPNLVKERARYGRLSKPIATVIAGVKLLYGSRTMPVSLKIGAYNRTFKTPFIFVGNNDYQMQELGFVGRKRLDRGILSVYVIHEANWLQMLYVAFRTFFGARFIGRSFDEFIDNRVEVRMAKTQVDVAYDGEIKRMPTPLIWLSRPASLKVRVPR